MSHFNAKVQTTTKGIRYLKLYTIKDLAILFVNLIIWNLIVTTLLWLMLNSLAGIISLVMISGLLIIVCASTDNTISLMEKGYKFFSALVYNKQFNEKALNFKSNIIKVKDNQVLLKTKDPLKLLLQTFLVLNHSEIYNLNDDEQGAMIEQLRVYLNKFADNYNLYSFNTTFNVDESIKKIRTLMDQEWNLRDKLLKETNNYERTDFRLLSADLVNLQNFKENIKENNFTILSFQKLVSFSKDTDKIFLSNPDESNSFHVSGTKLIIGAPEQYLMDDILDKIYNYNIWGETKKVKFKIKREYMIKKTISTFKDQPKKSYKINSYVTYLKLTEMPRKLENGYLYNLFHNPDHYNVVLRANHIDDVTNDKIINNIKTNLNNGITKGKTTQRKLVEAEKVEQEMDKIMDDLVVSGDLFRDMAIYVEIEASTSKELIQRIVTFIKQNKSNGYMFNSLKWQQYLAFSDFYETKINVLERAYDNIEATNIFKGAIQVFKYGKYSPYQIGNFNLWMSDALIAASLPGNMAKFIDKDGFYYGTESYSSDLAPVIINWWDKKYNNTHMVNIGVSGSGKSSSTFMLLRKALWEEKSKLILVDPKGEYEGFVKEHNGVVINSSQGFINPFTLLLNKKILEKDILVKLRQDPLYKSKTKEAQLNTQKLEMTKELENAKNLKINFLSGFLEILLGLHRNIESENLKLVLLKDIIFNNYTVENASRWNFDYFYSLIEQNEKLFLESMGTKEFSALKKNLYQFTSQGAEYNVFITKNLDLNNKIVSFTTEASQSQVVSNTLDAVNFQIMEYINFEKLQNKNVKKHITVLIEEFHFLLKYKQMLEAFKGLFRVSRSYMLRIILNFQEFSVLDNESAGSEMAAILGNVTFFNIFNTMGKEFDKFKSYILSTAIKISEFEEKELQSFPNRRSLLLTSKSKVVLDWDLENFFDPKASNDKEAKMRYDILWKDITNLWLKEKIIEIDPNDKTDYSTMAAEYDEENDVSYDDIDFDDINEIDTIETEKIKEEEIKNEKK